jgi:hypothetical protein
MGGCDWRSSRSLQSSTARLLRAMIRAAPPLFLIIIAKSSTTPAPDSLAIRRWPPPVRSAASRWSAGGVCGVERGAWSVVCGVVWIIRDSQTALLFLPLQSGQLLLRRFHCGRQRTVALEAKMDDEVTDRDVPMKLMRTKHVPSRIQHVPSTCRLLDTRGTRLRLVLSGTSSGLFFSSCRWAVVAAKLLNRSRWCRLRGQRVWNLWMQLGPLPESNIFVLYEVRLEPCCLQSVAD